MLTENAEKRRPIRSFVRRESRITPGQKRAFEKLWDNYGIVIQREKLNYPAIFGRDAPMVLEIGFGMGDSLVEFAKAKPEWNFIGIEVHRPGVGALLNKLEQENITNVRIFWADAIDVLNCCIADNSIDQVQIFFPDPWPKKRHQKRRLIQPGFIELIGRKLATAGKLHLATDSQNYAEHMLEIISQYSGFKNLANDKKFSVCSNRPLTKYEKRGKKLGHDIWDLIFEKTSLRSSIC